MENRKSRKVKFVNDPHLRGAFGEANLETGIIRINRKKHQKGKSRKNITPNKDGSENLLITMLHEKGHVDHPKKSEKAVEKLARAMKERMTPKQKKRMYSKLHG